MGNTQHLLGDGDRIGLEGADRHQMVGSIVIVGHDQGIERQVC
jgi:hypothetical protein